MFYLSDDFFTNATDYIDSMMSYYNWIQNQSLGAGIETLIAIILGTASLFAAIWMVRTIISFFTNNTFLIRFLAFGFVVIGIPAVLYLEFDFIIQPLMFIIFGVYTACWLVKEAYYMFYLHQTD
jgi:hypothetical protein